MNKFTLIRIIHQLLKLFYQRVYKIYRLKIRLVHKVNFVLVGFDIRKNRFDLDEIFQRECELVQQLYRQSIEDADREMEENIQYENFEIQNLSSFDILF